MATQLKTKDLSAHNTLALPCIAEHYSEVSSREELGAYLCKLDPNSPLLVLGGGSNLVLPEALNVPVLKITNTDVRYEVCGDATLVHVCAGREWDALVAEVVAKGLRGLENLSLIPGTVGAAPVQNIGAYGVELKDTLVSVEVFDRQSQSFVNLSNEQCLFSYRDSIFKRQAGRFVIYQATFLLSSSRAFDLQYGELKALQERADISLVDVRNTVISVRQAKLPDPSALPNAGSFFKNPIVSKSQCQALKQKFPGLVAYPVSDAAFKLAAGWLIDQAGWKGVELGPVAVHSKQALVLVNKGGATQADVQALARKIQADIFTRYGVALEIEPIVVL